MARPAIILLDSNDDAQCLWERVSPRWLYRSVPLSRVHSARGALRKTFDREGNHAVVAVLGIAVSLLFDMGACTATNARLGSSCGCVGSSISGETALRCGAWTIES